MRSLMRVSSVEIAASPLGAQPPTRNDGGRVGSVHRRTGASAGWPATDRTREDPRGRRPVGTDRWTCNPTSHRLCTCEDTSVSSLWTPSGEHRPPDQPPDRPPAGVLRAAAAGPAEREPTPEEVEALREVHARLVATPVEDVVANHALGIWQLALVHLGVITPPDAEGRPPVPDLAGRRARDRRDGRARRRARRAARRPRGGAARRADPGADAVRRGLRDRRPNLARERERPSSRSCWPADSCASSRVAPRARARARRRGRRGPQHVRLDAGARRRGRVPRATSSSPLAERAAGRRLAFATARRAERPRRRLHLVPRSAALAGRRRAPRQHRDRRDVARGLGAAHRR